MACAAAFAVTACAAPAPEGERDSGGSDTAAAEVSAELVREVREADGRVLVHFDLAGDGGREAARTDTVRLRELAESLCCDVLLEVHRIYSILPAVAATADPDRLSELLGHPRVRYVEPDRRLRPSGDPDTGVSVMPGQDPSPDRVRDDPAPPGQLKTASKPDPSSSGPTGTRKRSISPSSG